MIFSPSEVLQISKKTEIVETIQFLRFVAATMVLVAHISYYIHNRFDSDVRILGELAQGVALFFVISGFIMTVTGNSLLGKEGAARYFVLSRLIRIVPLYWIMNVAKLIGLLTLPGMIMANPTVSNVILSFMFLPARNADGIVEAFYGVGWSLNFEMAFYMLFAFALLVRVRPLFLVIPVLLIAAALFMVKTDKWPAISYLFSPTLMNFVWGILIGEWFLARRSLPTTVSVVLIMAGAALIFIPLGLPKLIMYLNLGFGAIVWGFVALEGKLGPRIPKLFTFLGDASYSLYLTHPMFGVIAVAVFYRFAPSMPPLLLFILVTLLSLVFAVAVYTLLEKPTTRWLRNRFLPGSKKINAI